MNFVIPYNIDVKSQSENCSQNFVEGIPFFNEQNLSQFSKISALNNNFRTNKLNPFSELQEFIGKTIQVKVEDVTDFGLTISTRINNNELNPMPVFKGVLFSTPVYPPAQFQQIEVQKIEIPKNSEEISKKRKRNYTKSGLYRKDKNGNFIFSTNDRIRLSQLITDPVPKSPNPTPDDSAFTFFFREQSSSLSSSTPEKLSQIISEQWKVLPLTEKHKYQQMSTSTSSATQRSKRPLNGYNIFCKKHFEEVKRENPGLGINQLSKIMGERWKALKEEEKQVYYQQVEKTPRFKKPLNSYNIYCKKNFESLKKQFPDRNINELSKIIAQNWKALTVEEKQVYYDLADAQKFNRGEKKNVKKVKIEKIESPMVNPVTYVNEFDYSNFVNLNNINLNNNLNNINLNLQMGEFSNFENYFPQFQNMFQITPNLENTSSNVQITSNNENNLQNTPNVEINLQNASNNENNLQNASNNEIKVENVTKSENNVQNFIQSQNNVQNVTNNENSSQSQNSSNFENINDDVNSVSNYLANDNTENLESYYNLSDTFKYSLVPNMENDNFF